MSPSGLTDIDGRWALALATTSVPERSSGPSPKRGLSVSTRRPVPHCGSSIASHGSMHSGWGARWELDVGGVVWSADGTLP